MAVPKRKKSKSKTRSRRNSQQRELVATQPCPACGAPHQPHRVCLACGSYRGRQVLSIETAE